MRSPVLHKPYLLLELAPDRRKRKRQLGRIVTDVPLRSEGRSTDHTEIYSIIWMLRTDCPKQMQPIKVVHSDRPDIQLQCANLTIGIEITEAVSSNNASMDRLRETEPHLWRTPGDDIAIFFPRRAGVGEDKLTAKAQRQLIRDNQPGEPWCGNGAESWAEAMAYFVSQKMKKADGYVRFDQNWLLIYDNWNEPGRRVELADAALDRIFQTEGVFNTFDRVMIQDGHSLASFCASGIRRQRRPRHGR